MRILLPPLGEKTRPAILFGKKNRLGLKLETKVGTRFPRAFLDDFDIFQKNSIKFCFTKRRGYLWKRSFYCILCFRVNANMSVYLYMLIFGPLKGLPLNAFENYGMAS